MYVYSIQFLERSYLFTYGYKKNLSAKSIEETHFIRNGQEFLFVDGSRCECAWSLLAHVASVDEEKSALHASDEADNSGLNKSVVRIAGAARKLGGSSATENEPADAVSLADTEKLGGSCGLRCHTAHNAARAANMSLLSALLCNIKRGRALRCPVM